MIPQIPVKYEIIVEINEALKVHNEHKKKIYQHINEFKELNPRVREFVLLGSSCAIMIDALFLPNVNDIDIGVFDTLKSNITKVNGVDCQCFSFLHPEYMDRVIDINGIKCLSRKDLLMNMIFGLYKNKPRVFAYVSKLSHGLNKEEIISMFEETLNRMKNEMSEASKLHARTSIDMYKNMITQERIGQCYLADRFEFITLLQDKACRIDR